jgi:hypothetical protein
MERQWITAISVRFATNCVPSKQVLPRWILQRLPLTWPWLSTRNLWKSYQYLYSVKLQCGVVLLVTSSLDYTPADNGCQAVFTANICERNASLITEVSSRYTMLDMATPSVKEHPHFSQLLGRISDSLTNRQSWRFVYNWPPWSPSLKPLHYPLWVT